MQQTHADESTRQNRLPLLVHNMNTTLGCSDASCLVQGRTIVLAISAETRTTSAETRATSETRTTLLGICAAFGISLLRRVLQIGQLPSGLVQRAPQLVTFACP